MSRVLTIMITYALIALTLSFLLRQVIKENEDEFIQNLGKEHIIVHYPRFYRWVGITCAVFFSCFIILMTIFPNGSAEPWVYFEFSLFVLLGLYLILESYLWRISIDKKEDYFDFVSSFGRKYRIRYEDIVNYRVGNNFLKIKTKKKVFYFDTKAINLEYLPQMLKRITSKKFIQVKRIRSKRSISIFERNSLKI